MQKLQKLTEKWILPTKGGISLSFKSDQRSANTLLTSGGPQCVRLWKMHWLALPLVVVVSFSPRTHH